MTFSIKYTECPNCKQWYATTEIMSYSTHGNIECWSDGKCFHPNLSEYSSMPFSKCENCGELFWFAETRQVEEHEIDKYLKKTTNEKIGEQIIPKHRTEKDNTILDFIRKKYEDYVNKTIHFLDYPALHYYAESEYFILDFLKLLDTSDELSTENEIYIRIKLWQHINDLIRKTGTIFKEFISIRFLSNIKIFFRSIKEKKKSNRLYRKYAKIRTENMEILSKLLQKTNKMDGDDTVLLIELHRELGNFQKAKEIIYNADASDKEYHKKFISKSEKLIPKKSVKVFKIK